MKIGIIACESFERGLEFLTKDDPEIVHKEYLEFGLHEHPEELKRIVIEKVNALQGKVDAVLLGYGVCNSLKDITDKLSVPTVRLEGDDCIGVMITQAEYERERKVCAGTMYHTPYFARMDRSWFVEHFEREMPNYRELGIDPDWYLQKMFDGYVRVLFIDDQLGGLDELLSRSRDFASELGLKHECRKGTMLMLIEGLERAKELARSVSGEEASTMAENGAAASATLSPSGP